ncbi:MAG: cobalamin B12-binding domain-containing protein, partial [Verrucomicrobia bacterium]|nr:cobalamin B12-binding domain-containing protein [Verrucomicrobiota bacterium]
MPDIVLTTINARFIHAAFGLRCLFANLGDLQARAEVMEFDLQHRALDIVERLLARSPRVVGFGVYIWNVQLTTQVVTVLKRLRPDVQVVLGGPEVSHEADDQEIVERADFVLQGEADLSFALLCRQILESPDSLAGRKIIESPLPALEQVKLAYDFYTDD